jgi:thiamine phosphate synthase YjbQ (UPF0047 family)
LKAYLKSISIITFGPMELHPIRKIIEDAIAESGVEIGSILVSVEGATPALLILERGLEKSIIKLLETLVPYTIWRHGNAYAHLISTILSTSLTIPIKDSNIVLDKDYEVYLLETRAVYNHKRRVLIYIHGS